MIKTMTAGFPAKLPNFFHTKFGKFTFACQTSSIQVVERDWGCFWL